MTDSIKFVVSGHVDHGKSTLCGHMLYKCNYINDHEMKQLEIKAEQNGMKGWKYAYVLDLYDEERENGKTVDYVAVDFEYKSNKYTLIDTPGHKHFIRSLITGLNNDNSNKIIGCLIVSAIENEFIAGMTNGQTKEDMILMRAVGIEHIVVVINKMDIYNYDEDIYKKRCDAVAEYIMKVGFKTIEYIMISAFHDKNIFELLDKITILYDKIAKTEIITINSDKVESEIITAQVKIIHLENDILAPGCECVCHIKKNEYQIIIDDLRLFDLKTKKITNKKFAKVNDVIYIKLKRLETKDNKKVMFEACLNDRIILRRNDATMGFGKIVKFA